MVDSPVSRLSPQPSIVPQIPPSPMKTFTHHVVCFSLLCTGSVLAQNSLNFGLGNPSGGENIQNQLIFSNGGITARATGWSVSRTASSPVFQASQVAQWSPGIGVKNSSEYITDTPYVPYYVDNQDHYDFVLFVFSEKVEIDSVTVSPSAGTYDLDVSLWLGNVDSNLNLTGNSFADLNSLGFGTRVDDDWYATNSPRNVNLATPVGGVNAMLVGGRVGGDSSFDRFKVNTVYGATVIPEPSPVGLLGLAAVMLAARRRR